jgi:phosphoglycolate phosphatase-like HAD superfamily hydrolase
MAKKATSPDLAAAYEAHLEETEEQVERLEQVFEMLDKAPRGKTCPAIDGIVEEAEEILKEAKSDTVRDAGSLAAAQAVEHYEISRYFQRERGRSECPAARQNVRSLTWRSLSGSHSDNSETRRQLNIAVEKALGACRREGLISVPAGM